MNLYLALYHEHKDRTKHDIYESDTRLERVSCCVCAYLDQERRVVEKDMARQKP